MTSKRKDLAMRRATADRLLEGVEKRIRIVNTDPYFCYRITEAVVFGSYVNAPEKDMLGDLDIALRLEPRYDIESLEFTERQAQCKGTSILQILDWPREEVLRYVRNRSAYISIHTLGHKDQDEIIFSDSVRSIDVGEIV